MTDAWAVSTVVAVVAGVVGFFVVLRGATFAAHAVPMSAFAGAAGATLLGLSAIAGLGVLSPLAALGIGWLGRRRRADVATALVVMAQLGLGALFLSWTSRYAQQAYALLFGEVLGVTRQELGVTLILAVVALVAAAVLYRPLLLTSVVPEVAEARGIAGLGLDLSFLLLVAAVTTTAVPVVGTLLVFSLMVGPPAAARLVVRGPLGAMAVSIVLALVTVWTALAASSVTQWPVGFFVGTIGAVWYVAARAGAAWQGRRASPRPHERAPARAGVADPVGGLPGL